MAKIITSPSEQIIGAPAVMAPPTPATPPSEKIIKPPTVITPPSEVIIKPKVPVTPPSEVIIKPPIVEEPLKELAPGPPPLIVGTSPAEDLVIVKDPYTGETYFKPGTPEQIAEVVSFLAVPGAVLPDIPYSPPPGIALTKPITGSLAVEPKRRGPITVYDYRGLPIEVSRGQATDLYELKGKEQFERMKELGILQGGSEFVPGLTEDEWSYRTPAQVKATERFVQSLRETSPELYKAYKEGGYGAYEAALVVEYKKLPWAWDYETNKWAKVPWETYEAREEFYRQFPMIGPPGTPGKMTPVEAQRQYEEFQAKLRSGEIITVGNGEYAYSRSMGKPDDPGYILGYNDMSENWQDYADEHGMVALIDKLQTETFVPYSVSNLDKIMTEGTWHEKSYINSAITAAGLFEVPDVRLVGPGAPPAFPKKWEDLTSEERQRVADIYKPPGTWVVETTQWLEKWGGVKKLTIEKADEAVHNMGIIGENRSIASNIAKAMADADVPVSAISPRGTEVPMEAVAESWDNLTSDEKLKVLEHYRTSTERIADFQVKAEEATKDWLNLWKEEDPALWREIKALPRGLLEVAQGITIGMGGSIFKSFTSLVEGHPKSSVVQLSEVPIGMAQWATIESSKRIAEPLTPGVGLLVGNLAIPVALKGVRGAIGGTKTAFRMGETLVKKGVLPRAYKGGGLDIVIVRVPDAFKSLTKEQVKEIFESNLSPAEQMAKVEATLEPKTAAVYRTYMQLVEEVKNFVVPDSMIRPVDFTVIKGVTPEMSMALKTWLQRHPDVKVVGSVADWFQTKGVNDMFKPGDFDFDIIRGSSLKLSEARSELSKILKGQEFDLHVEGAFGQLPYGWKSLRPIKIEGITFEPLVEQFYRRTVTTTSPGVEQSFGLMGPKVKTLAPGEVVGVEVGAHIGRVKDVPRLGIEYRGIAEVFEKMGDVAKANRIRELVNFVETAPRGKPLSVPAQRALVEEFIKMVDEVQAGMLERGTNFKLVGPEGTLYGITSPANRVMSGTLYHATTNLADYVRTLREKGYVEAGRYLDETGKWVKAERPQIFTSPELAFDRLYDFKVGRIPEGAGVVAIRTVAKDLKEITGPFRTETFQEVGKRPYQAVLNERLLSEGYRTYPTDPTGLSLRKGSVSEGLTGEVVTYHPRTKRSVSVLYFVTEEARKAGLSAPNLVQSRSMNLLAIKATLADLLHPHLPKRFVVTAEPIRGASIIEFYRDTYKWKGKPKAEIAKAVAEQDKILRVEATDNLKAKGKDKLLPEEYAKALDEEIARVSSKKAIEVLSDKDVQRMLTEFSANEIARTYYLNLRELYSKMAAAGLGSTSTTIGTLTSADVPTLPSLVGTVTPKMLESIVPTTVPAAVPTKVITPTTPTITPVITPTTPTGVVMSITPTITPVTTPVTTPITEITEVTIPLTRTVVTGIPVPVTVPPLVPPVTRPLPLLPSGMTKEKRPRIPLGSITWRQGMLKVGDELRPVWKYIPPPFDMDKPITLLAPPAGAKNIEMRTPEETIQQIGRGPVPADISIDLGVADIYVSEGGKRIRYEGKGLKTDIGKRIEGTEKGMSVPEAQTPLGLAGLKLGTSFGEYITREPKNEAQGQFLNREVARMMSEMSPEQIVDEIRLAGLTEPKYEVPGKGKGRGLGVDANKLRVNRLLEQLPDRVRAEVRRLLMEGELEYVSVGRGRYAELRPPWRRTKPVKVGVLKKSEKERKEKKPKKTKTTVPELSGTV